MKKYLTKLSLGLIGLATIVPVGALAGYNEPGVFSFRGGYMCSAMGGAAGSFIAWIGTILIFLIAVAALVFLVVLIQRILLLNHTYEMAIREMEAESKPSLKKTLKKKSTKKKTAKKTTKKKVTRKKK